MSYRRKPNYHFRTENDIGIYKVPIGRLIVVEDFDGRIRCFLKLNDWNVSVESTIIESVIVGALGEIPILIGSEIEINSNHRVLQSDLKIGHNNNLVIREE